MDKGAVLSDCGKYRFRLWRRWGSEPTVAFVMLNPSTADASEDDPTIRKCIGFAKLLGHGGIEVVNLYAFRATKPEELKRNGYPRHSSEDRHLLDGCKAGSRVIAAWGAHARKFSRRVDVMTILDTAAQRVFALALTDDGIPRHPLMLGYNESALLPFNWWAKQQPSHGGSEPPTDCTSEPKA